VSYNRLGVVPCMFRELVDELAVGRLSGLFVGVVGWVWFWLVGGWGVFCGGVFGSGWLKVLVG